MNGIDPPSKPLRNYSKIESNAILSTCKKCGCTHGMVVEEMATGKTEPIDLCKECLFYGTYIPITEQIHLREEDVLQNLDKEFIAEQMEKMIDYMMRKFIENWVMYGEGEPILDVPKEMEDQYIKAYKACSKQWEEAEIDKRFVTMDFVHHPEPITADKWKERLKIMARDLVKSQKEINNGK